MQKEFVRLEELEPTIRKVLERDGTFTFLPRGTSMMPFIVQGRDKVMLTALPDGKLKKYQVVLYKRENGAFVLHRIIKERNEIYTMRGDHQYWKEEGIRKEQMLGVAEAVIRDGKKRKIDGCFYNIKVMFWVKTTFLRKLGHDFRMMCRVFVKK